ncbi:hypothetical protein PR202_ga06953 [Eleusine coracana subsp. coracana]|uniref:Haloacid dehalogenase-like hydrolase family protein n=1 Tax=Eleusine coracana subsp. coracana TaxID=191504 RepID=A0AAV5BXF6_ELECO|nr:hypothetical protein PR202_ga06953 [Eleusine coracana subsp. coracana]
MARLHYLVSRALASQHVPLPSPTTSSLRPTPRPPLSPLSPPTSSPLHGRTLLPFAVAATSRKYASATFRRRRRASSPPMLLRRRRARRPTRKGPGELSVQIGIEEDLPDDPEILVIASSIAEMLRTDVGKAVKLAFVNLEVSEYKTRDTCISNVNKYDSMEVSMLLCDDNFIRKLNKEWRDEDRATDVLSMSQHIPGLDIPILQLGDIVISVETARRQAEERGHMLVDEIRILMVHGLLHLLGFDHELGEEAEEEMEKEEERILNTLEWKGKGLIRSAYDADTNVEHLQNSGDANSNIEKMSQRQEPQTKLSHIICDIDGTLLNHDGCLHEESIESLRDAIAEGVNVIMVTGKSRASTVRTFKLHNPQGNDVLISETSPGVFLQGSLVYARHGQEIYRANLDANICKEVVKVMPSIEDLLEYSSIQKLLFFDNVEEDSSVLVHYCSELTEGKARVIQIQPHSIEIVPLNASKGDGLRILLDHLGITDVRLDSYQMHCTYCSIVFVSFLSLCFLIY